MTEKASGRVAEQRERILTAAKQCFVEHGLAHTTMRDIATQAEMSLGNIYRYFKNKETLIKNFIEDDNQVVGDAFELLDNAKNFKAMLQEIGCAFIKETADKAVLTVYTDILSEALRNEKTLSIVTLDHAERTLAKCLEKAQKDKRIQLTIPVDAAALAMMAFIESASIKCVTNKKYSIRTAQKQFKAYVNIFF